MEILDELKVSGSCRIQDLARRLDVSEETIRRNVKKLAGRGLVRKVHGGVYLPDAVQEAPFAQRMDENPDAKRLIAGQVARMIKNGDSLILDIGSTTAYVARSEEHTSELQSLMRISYAVFCLQKKTKKK